MEQIIEMKQAAVASQKIEESYYTKFKKFLELDESPKTIDTYMYAIKQFAKWISARGITQPTREDIIDYREELKATHKPSTVQNYITALKLFFRWTAQEELYPNIADHIKGAKLDKGHKKDYLTSRQVKKVLDTAREDSIEGLRNYAMLALMFTGALRTVEVTRANIEDIRTAGDSTVLYIQGKGHEEKTVYIKLAPEVEDAISAYLNARGAADPTEPLFTSVSHSNNGDRLTTRSVSRIVKNALIEAGFNSDKLTAHSTRHTAVTLALLGGETLEEVQQFARHANINTTLIYAHNLDRAKNHCESTIASAIF